MTDSNSKIEMKKPKGYYVYSIHVDGIVRYIGKGKGLRMYSHMKEVRGRLNREFKLENIGSFFQRKLTEAVMQGAEIVEELLVDDLTDKGSYRVEHDKLKEIVFDGKRNQLWNVIPGNICTSEERAAYISRLKGNLSSKDWMIRYLSGRTLEIMTKNAGTRRASEYQSAKKREAREGSPWLRLQRNLLNQYLARGGKDKLKIGPMLGSLEGKSDKEVLKRLFGT